MVRVGILLAAVVIAMPLAAQRAHPVNPVPAVSPVVPGMPIPHTLRVGGLISGSIPYTGAPLRGPGSGPHYPGRNRTVVVPYAVPVWAGGYYGYPDYGYAQQPNNVTVVVPNQPTSSVIVNQDYTPQQAGTPVLRDYSNVPLPESGMKVYSGPQVPQEAATTPEAKATVYLIALKDTTVRQAIGYWVDKDTLHYVTPKGTVTRLALAMVDKDFTVQLNRERQLEFDWARTMEPQQ